MSLDIWFPGEVSRFLSSAQKALDIIGPVNDDYRKGYCDAIAVLAEMFGVEVSDGVALEGVVDAAYKLVGWEE